MDSQPWIENTIFDPQLVDSRGKNSEFQNSKKDWVRGQGSSLGFSRWMMLIWERLKEEIGVEGVQSTSWNGGKHGGRLLQCSENQGGRLQGHLTRALMHSDCSWSYFLFIQECISATAWWTQLSATGWRREFGFHASLPFPFTSFFSLPSHRSSLVQSPYQQFPFTSALPHPPAPLPLVFWLV